MQLQSSLVKNAFTASIPVCMGYIPLGIVFGFLCVQAGASWWIPPISSVLIYGGAVQYMMIPMLAADMSVASIAFATAVVNLRHVFYGLSLLDRLHSAGWKKWLIAFLLTDETYSLITTEKKDAPIDRLVLIALFDYSWWILGSLIGGSARPLRLNWPVSTLFSRVFLRCFSANSGADVSTLNRSGLP